MTEHFIPKVAQHFVPKGWGYERWICNYDAYCGKLLSFVKGKCCSWHYHAVKDEVLLLHSGSLKVLYSLHTMMMRIPFASSKGTEEGVMLVGLNMSGSLTHFKTKERRFLGEIEILDEQILCQSGSYKRVKRWLRGVHPKLGVIHRGYTGWETIQEVDVLVPMGTFTVVEA